MIATPVQTLEAFLQRPDIDKSPGLELLESGVASKPMATFEHSELQFNLVAAIRAGTKDYRAYQELRCNVAGLSLIPDISVVTTSDSPRGHYDGAPVWVIEIRSPGQGTGELTEKILYCLRHGSQLGWLIDPQRDRITVWTQDEDEVYSESAVVPALGLLDLSVEQILALQG